LQRISPIILCATAESIFAGWLNDAASQDLKNEDLLETEQAPLDMTIQLLPGNEQPVELARKLSLLRVGDKARTLQVDK
jgi:hypothetical protein